ncbi:MAG TPA: S8 family serine peptidase [Actinoplanes sp.]|jgi:serine protease AprX
MSAVRQSQRHVRLLCRLTGALLAPLLLAGSLGALPADRAVPGGGWNGLWLSSDPLAAGGTSLKDVRTIIGADVGTAARLTGAGVGIAMIDTGVAPVPGLPASQIVNGPDLSFESQSPALRYLDTYGHGTHLAGIMVGADTASGAVGLAPKARLTSLKLGTANGAADVTQVIAAVDWVVAHRNDDPANPIRVLNLSYGSGGTPYNWNDPLDFAVQRAWLSGIVVVAAVGNDGNGSLRLANPASDLRVISVAASTTKGTVATADDELSAYSNMSTAEKLPDLVAPGQSIASLRVPGSNVDNGYPAARQGETLFRGTGTSQAAAVASAAAALLLQARPSLTPDQVKDVLKRGTALKLGLGAARGLKQINVNTALGLAATTATQTSQLASWQGTLDASRGSSRLVSNGAALSGQRSPFGAFDSQAWWNASLNRTSWKGGRWMGHQIAGDGWTGTSFASRTWGAATWQGTPWDGASSWVDPSWTGRFWAGRFWAAGTWSGRFWASEDWATASWG